MSDRRKPFPFDEFEPAWQARWDAERTFRTTGPGEPGFDASKPKFYVLDMFPYPSGAGLHVGHPEGYTATDILARARRMQGFNVLHPMGWDAFGLPAEQYAIKTGQHPRLTTEANIANFRRQLKSLGFSYDWEREVDTTDPGYVRWTQWIFLRLYHSYYDTDGENGETGGGTRGPRLEQGANRRRPPGLCGRGAGQLVARPRDRAGQRGGRGVALERPCRRTPPAAPMDAAHHRLRRPLDRRTRRPRLAGGHQAAPAQLDRQKRGRGGGIPAFPAAGDVADGFHHAARHPVRRDLHGARARSIRWSMPSPPRSRRPKWKPTGSACASKSDLERTELAKEKTGVFTGAMPSIRSTARKSPSGLPTTCSWATAPEPSWPCPPTTSATSPSPPNSICPSCPSSSRRTAESRGVPCPQLSATRAWP